VPRPILIASHQGNIVAEAIAGKLQVRGHKPYIIHTDKICQASVPFSFHFSQKGAFLTYKDWQLDLKNVGSAWYWRAIVEDVRNNADVKREMQKTLLGVWETIDEARWLNHPYSIKRTQNKLAQLRQAQRIGLRIIPTIAANSIRVIEQSMTESIIIKMPGKGLIYNSDGPQVLYSTKLHRDDLTNVRANPFPGMYQPFLSKKKEWRITVVGDNVFSAAIYTDKYSKTDWRLNSHDEAAVRFVAEAFPKETAQKCKKLLQTLGLRYGAFDFIETDDDELYFVEVNTNGQFMWLEKKLGFPISEAIADELIAIAQS
jgi:glutathione synthase/RimK-type ligase-like ATP-grasp enzyme